MSPANPIPPRAEVYVDGVHFGDIESLKTISVTVLKRVEYLSAMDATTRFGTNNTGGAILISTR
jgi:outer membrane receptor protein involved in Fe transport